MTRILILAQCSANNDRLFIDAAGFPCTAWRDFNCSVDTANFAGGTYNPRDMRDVRDRCPAACRLCRWVSGHRAVLPAPHDDTILLSKALSIFPRKQASTELGNTFRSALLRWSLDGYQALISRQSRLLRKWSPEENDKGRIAAKKIAQNYLAVSRLAMNIPGRYAEAAVAQRFEAPCKAFRTFTDTGHREDTTPHAAAKRRWSALRCGARAYSFMQDDESRFSYIELVRQGNAFVQVAHLSEAREVPGY